MKRIVNIEHNLDDYELEETLSKALRSIRLAIQRPNRKIHAPALEQIAVNATKSFSHQMSGMISDMEGVIADEG